MAHTLFLYFFFASWVEGLEEARRIPPDAHSKISAHTPRWLCIKHICTQVHRWVMDRFRFRSPNFVYAAEKVPAHTLAHTYRKPKMHLSDPWHICHLRFVVRSTKLVGDGRIQSVSGQGSAHTLAHTCTKPNWYLFHSKPARCMKCRILSQIHCCMQ